MHPHKGVQCDADKQTEKQMFVLEMQFGGLWPVPPKCHQRLAHPDIHKYIYTYVLRRAYLNISKDSMYDCWDR